MYKHNSLQMHIQLGSYMSMWWLYMHVRLSVCLSACMCLYYQYLLYGSQVINQLNWSLISIVCTEEDHQTFLCGREQLISMYILCSIPMSSYCSYVYTIPYLCSWPHVLVAVGIGHNAGARIKSSIHLWQFGIWITGWDGETWSSVVMWVDHTPGVP